MADKDKALKTEYTRWKDYAKVLLLASTVMLGLTGTSVAAGVTLYLGILIGLSAIAGAVTIICTVAWHAREHKMQIQKKPAFLLIASYSFGFQTGFFMIAIAQHFLVIKDNA